METKKKMHIFSMKPIEFMVKGEKGYISSTSIYLVFEGDSLENMEIFLYIQKNAPILAFNTSGYELSIEKIGDNNESGDFYIEFPKNVHYPFLTITDIKNLNLLPRVKIDFTIETLEEATNKSNDYSKLDFSELMKYIWSYLENPNFLSHKDKVNNMIKLIPSSLMKTIKNYDDEGLLIMIQYWNNELEEEQENPSNGERKKTAIIILNMIVDILEKEKEEREKKKKDELEILDLEKLSIPELDKKMQESIASSDFETSAKIRDIIKKKQDNS